MRFASLFAALLCATIANAEDVQVATATTTVSFTSIDRNGDNRISKTEAGTYKYLIDRFAYIDTDGDGFISQDELIASLTQAAAR
ncbi:hypothetical protein [Povalibacter sp.]|uniref:hypothetical protein n=1 Tax=Povalibacter sp. TaxID=1962978 RepID=UPI002F40C670